MDVEQLRDLPPRDRAVSAGNLAADYQTKATECAQIRREALRELEDAGMSRTDLAVLLGVSEARVGQILRGGTVGKG